MTAENQESRRDLAEIQKSRRPKFCRESRRDLRENVLPDNARGNLIRRPAAFDSNLSDTRRAINPVRGNLNVAVLVSRTIFFVYFPQLLSRYKSNEIIIKTNPYFYKEIAQFPILVAIIGN